MNYDSNKIPYIDAKNFIEQFIEDHPQWHKVASLSIRAGFGEVSTTLSFGDGQYIKAPSGIIFSCAAKIDDKKINVKARTKYDFLAKLEKKILKEHAKKG